MTGRTFNGQTGEVETEAPTERAEGGQLQDMPPVPNWVNWGLVILFGWHLLKGFFKDE